eukprot:1059372_1
MTNTLRLPRYCNNDHIAAIHNIMTATQIHCRWLMMNNTNGFVLCFSVAANIEKKVNALIDIALEKVLAIESVSTVLNDVFIACKYKGTYLQIRMQWNRSNCGCVLLIT